jgi:allantoinase
MTVIAEFDGLLIAHAEDGHSVTQPHGRAYGDFLASRPDAAERRAIDALLAETARTGCRTHVVHLSSAACLPLIAEAKAAGLPVTVETCPHYLTFTAEDVPDGATQFKCCPPIRGAANREGLWQGLLDGTIDLVASDHSPSTVAQKRLDSGDFGQAWGGIASLQLSLPAVWTEASARGATLGDVARWMSAAPAQLTGLTDRGAIAVGRQADLCAFAADETFVVDVAALHHRHPVTPYAGRMMRGVVRETYLRGTPAGGTRHGRLIRPVRLVPEPTA